MVGHENAFKGTVIKSLVNAEELTAALKAMIPSDITNDNVVFACIGTDRSTGDALGPLVGTYLEGLGYTNVVGTIDDPMHAVNLAERIEKLPAGKTVIAIDACLGQTTSVDTHQLIKGSLKPGAGLGKDLPSVGDYSISSIVNVGGFMEYFVLQNTRLSIVMKMAKDITTALMNRFPIESKAVQLLTTETKRKVRVVK